MPELDPAGYRWLRARAFERWRYLAVMDPDGHELCRFDMETDPRIARTINDGTGEIEIEVSLRGDDPEFVNRLPVRIAATCLHTTPKPPEMVKDGLLCAYMCNSNGEQILIDSSGNGLHGQLGTLPTVDAADPTWTDAGLLFGAGKLCRVGALAQAMQGLEGMTFQVVATSDTQVTHAGVFGQSNPFMTGTPNILQILNDSDGGSYRDGLYISVHGTGTGFAVVKPTPAIGPTPTPLTVRFEGGVRLQARVNGGPWFTASATAVPCLNESITSPETYQLGRRMAYSFDGPFTAVLVYNHALSDAEAAQNETCLMAIAERRSVGILGDFTDDYRSLVTYNRATLAEPIDGVTLDHRCHIPVELLSEVN